MIMEQLSDQHIAGASVAVVKDGSLFFAKGYGYADVENKIPVDPEKTIFRVGSIGKLFTWTAVMQLVEQGKLDLDADVNQYLDFTIPDTFPEPITLTHLMTHTPGFEDVAFGGAATTPEDLVPNGIWLARNIPVRAWVPGEVASYSNYGASLAGYIVERVSGLSYEEYVEQYILSPLGMAHSTPRQVLPAAVMANVSRGYNYFDNAFHPQGFEYMTIVPAGGMSASATDMGRFMIAHLQYGRYCETSCEGGETRILNESTARQMQSRVWAADERLNGLTYGFVEYSRNGHRVIGHYGDNIFFHSILALLPEQNVGLFISYNTMNGIALTRPAFEAFMDRYYPAPVAASPVSMLSDAKDTDRFAGNYQYNRVAFSKGGKLRGLFARSFTVQAGSNGELLIAGNGGTRRFVQVSPLYFEEIEGEGHMIFREDSAGEITHLFPNDQPTSAARKVAWYEGLSFNLGLLGVSAILFLSVLLAEFVRMIVGMFRRRSRLPQPVMARLARGAMIVLALLALPLMVGLYMQAGDPWGLASGQRTLLTILGGMSIVVVLLTGVTVTLTGMSWRRGWWSLIARMHYSLVAAVSIAFVWFLAFWNQIGWQWW
jgi:CubicO group peptidase (beta-lactamase class C family)